MNARYMRENREKESESDEIWGGYQRDTQSDQKINIRSDVWQEKQGDTDQKRDDCPLFFAVDEVTESERAENHTPDKYRFASHNQDP